MYHVCWSNFCTTPEVCFQNESITFPSKLRQESLVKISAEHSLNKHFTRKKQHEAGPIVFCFHPPCQPRCPCRLGLAMKGSWCVRWPHTCTTFSKGNLRHLGRPTYHVLHVKLGHMRALKIHRFRFKLVMAFSNKIVANTYLRYTLYPIHVSCVSYQFAQDGAWKDVGFEKHHLRQIEGPNWSVQRG